MSATYAVVIHQDSLGADNAEVYAGRAVVACMRRILDHDPDVANSEVTSCLRLIRAAPTGLRPNFAANPGLRSLARTCPGAKFPVPYGMPKMRPNVACIRRQGFGSRVDGQQSVHYPDFQLSSASSRSRRKFTERHPKPPHPVRGFPAARWVCHRMGFFRRVLPNLDWSRDVG